MLETIKSIVAKLLNLLGICNLWNQATIKNNPNSIRVINYHRTPLEESQTFYKQIDYFEKTYKNVTYADFLQYRRKDKNYPTPALMITFDDGLMNNYTVAAPYLESHGFTGYFFVSTGKIGQPGYMTIKEIKDLIQRGHVIGCHTYTHHRMNAEDTPDLLKHEIVDAKKDLQDMLQSDISIFCWCGGEEDTYTVEAEQIIEKTYQFAFMTNNELVSQDTDSFHLQRTNIEARWSLSLVRFQLCGIMDALYKNKRNRVNAKTA